MNTQHPRLNRFTSPLNIGEILAIYKCKFYKHMKVHFEKMA